MGRWTQTRSTPESPQGRRALDTDEPETSEEVGRRRRQQVHVGETALPCPLEPFGDEATADTTRAQRGIYDDRPQQPGAPVGLHAGGRAYDAVDLDDGVAVRKLRFEPADRELSARQERADGRKVAGGCTSRSRHR